MTKAEEKAKAVIVTAWIDYLFLIALCMAAIGASALIAMMIVGPSLAGVLAFSVCTFLLLLCMLAIMLLDRN